MMLMERNHFHPNDAWGENLLTPQTTWTNLMFAWFDSGLNRFAYTGEISAGVLGSLGLL